VLTPQTLWRRKTADTKKALTPEMLWYQKSADTRRVLAPEIADARGPDISIPLVCLVSAFF